MIGCDVQTEPGQSLPYAPANHLVINEVYTLPSSNPNTHSWIEIYNPTKTAVNIRFWTLSFTTNAFGATQLTYYKRSGSSIVVDTVIIRFAQDTVGRFDFLFTIRDEEQIGPLMLGPGEFYTLVSNIERLRVYSSLGPGDGPEPKSTPFLIGDPRFVVIPRDTVNPQLTVPDTISFFSGLFFLSQKEQIILKDSVGRVVDVVRYGNYIYAGPGNDPYPSNQGVGVVPDFESIARYAGAYTTDNSANDFYITRTGLRPIPHWLSQLYKR